MSKFRMGLVLGVLALFLGPGVARANVAVERSARRATASSELPDEAECLVWAERAESPSAPRHSGRETRAERDRYIAQFGSWWARRQILVGVASACWLARWEVELDWPTARERGESARHGRFDPRAPSYTPNLEELPATEETVHSLDRASRVYAALVLEGRASWDAAPRSVRAEQYRYSGVGFYDDHASETARHLASRAVRLSTEGRFWTASSLSCEIRLWQLSRGYPRFDEFFPLAHHVPVEFLEAPIDLGAR